MIAYVCKYTPVELLSALGAEPVRLETNAVNFNHADAVMHPNVCSFAKSVLEDFAAKDYDGIVLTTCCDSVRRLYDALREEHPDKFIYQLDLPRAVNDTSVAMYRDSLKRMAAAYCEHARAELNEACLVDLLSVQGAQARRVDEPQDGRERIRIGLAGARHGAMLPALLEQFGAELVFDITCNGAARAVGEGRTGWHELSGDELMGAYARELLEQLPCARMTDTSKREDFLERACGQIDGLIYHTVKFCDMYSYEHLALRGKVDVPMLAIETDTTVSGEGQIRTRVEAFIESLRTKSSSAGASTGARRRSERNTPMYVLGIDSGSTSTNAAVLDEKATLVAYAVVRTGARSADSAAAVVDAACKAADITRDDLASIVSTGYGRVSVGDADLDVTEITCHARGAQFFDKGIRTILDIGGQDSKAIRLDEHGEVLDFAMNDKCAAGTGRFLEAMARTLEVGIEELGPLSLTSKNDVEISSMCTVFAESEVIGLIANNIDKADIAHGVHAAIAGKAHSLLRRTGIEDRVMMTGGVAKNPGVVAAVEERLGKKLVICDEPEIVGAVGAALIGLDRL